jgi:hypothetical protein
MDQGRKGRTHPCLDRERAIASTRLLPPERQTNGTNVREAATRLWTVVLTTDDADKKSGFLIGVICG